MERVHDIVLCDVAGILALREYMKLVLLKASQGDECRIGSWMGCIQVNM